MKKILKFTIAAVFAVLFFSGTLFAKQNAEPSNKPEEIVRPPLLRLTDSGYRLIWNTPGIDHVIFLGKKGEKGVAQQLTQILINGKNAGFYADFDDLEPDSEYFYQFNKQKKIKFRSPKTAGQTFTFAAIADHQILPEKTARGFKKVAAEKPDLIISAGDMLDNGLPENWRTNFFENISIFTGIPFAAAEGNNDSGRQLFRTYLASDERYYTCTYGSTRFIMISTNIPIREDTDEYKWLENVLQNNTSQWTIAVFHIGTYLSTDPDYSNLKFRDGLVTLLEKYRVDLVINGHNHLYDRTQPINEITYITIPCLSARLTSLQINEDSGYYAKTVIGKHGYALFTVAPEEISVKVKSTDGEILDTAVIRHNK